ncbi:MAG: UPF0104 family protein [Spirulina sp. SIO3F2]|nr:UPF0104 family protein [Spirulina sp. SIO3F2]
MRVFFSTLKRNAKPVVRWLITGGVLFFLASTLRQHWQAVTQQSLADIRWGYIAAALGISAIAHAWLGAVWGLILRQLRQPVPLGWATQVYLITNLAKYLPGNVWHLYGRIKTTTEQQQVTGAIATLSVVLESLLIAAAALLVTVLSFPSSHWPVQVLVLALALLSVHPRLLNPVIRLASRWKQTPQAPQQLVAYPLLPFGAEVVYILLRTVGFLLTLAAFGELELTRLPQLISAFAFAWLLGFVLPGAPGGVGVFEGTLLALLQGDFIVAIALYRLVSTLAEALGAGLAWLNGKRNQPSLPSL